MPKLVRNSIFTLVILALTALGLNWNKSIVLRSDPVQISDTVLSADVSRTKQPFLLEVEFAQERLKLGQTQEMRITTTANLR